MRIAWRPLVIPILTLALVGCEGEKLALVFGADESAVSVESLLVEVDGSEYTLERSESIVRREVEVEEGSVDIRLALIDTAGDVLVETELEKRIRDDRSHWVWVIVSTEETSVCEPPDLRLPVPGLADTMFVFSGSLPDDAVC